MDVKKPLCGGLRQGLQEGVGSYLEGGAAGEAASQGHGARHYCTEPADSPCGNHQHMKRKDVSLNRGK